MERVFVARVKGGTRDWVKVRTGETAGCLVEVFGGLREGDTVAVRGADEIRPGTRLTARKASPSGGRL